jgi:hypothetical protein
MQQIIAIHGATTFATYDSYLKSLATEPLILERFTYKPTWKELLKEKLGDEYQVLLPAMPNKTNARYSEWKVWFDHFSDLIADDCILIGHSMGAVFLAKYLSQHAFPAKIKATILVATPYNDESDEDLGDFKLESITDLFKSQAGAVFIINGNDDPVISAADIQKYKDDLPDAQFLTIPASDHFMRVDFPEMTNILKTLQQTRGL